MTRFAINLSPDEIAELTRLAMRQRRTPQQQAEHLIVQGIRSDAAMQRMMAMMQAAGITPLPGVGGEGES